MRKIWAALGWLGVVTITLGSCKKTGAPDKVKECQQLLEHAEKCAGKHGGSNRTAAEVVNQSFEGHIAQKYSAEEMAKVCKGQMDDFDDDGCYKPDMKGKKKK